MDASSAPPAAVALGEKPESVSAGIGQPRTLYSTFFHKVSSKNQVALPRPLLRMLMQTEEGQLFLVHLPGDPFLRLYTQRRFDDVLDEIRRSPKLEQTMKNLLVRNLSRNAHLVEPDPQGRFVLPNHYVEELGLKDEVAFCGSGMRVELWNPAKLREAREAEMRQVESIKTFVTDILDQ